MHYPIIIPHADRNDLLSDCLKSIPEDYQVYIIRGGSFAQNCNKGFRLIKDEEAVYFINDDTIIMKEALEEAADLIKSSDVVSINTQTINGKPLSVGIKYIDSGGIWPFIAIPQREAVHFPHGAAFLIRSELFRKLDGFCEEYFNGAEDVDLFLRAMELNARFNYTENAIIHYLSQSRNRWNNVLKSIETFNKRFPTQRIWKILGIYGGISI